MSNKTSQPVVMPKRESNKLIIKIGKIAIGHQSHISGTGVHGDSRTKRQRTRSEQNRTAIKESI